MVGAHGRARQSDVEPEVITETITEFRDRVVTRTETLVETVTVGETPYARFAEEEFTRTVAENSAPGTPVGAPVAVLRNSGNKVAYSLEGPDAALFTIEQDSGQILVGEGTLLDYESDTTSYTVEVVADPRSGANVKDHRHHHRDGRGGDRDGGHHSRRAARGGRGADRHADPRRRGADGPRLAVAALGQLAGTGSTSPERRAQPTRPRSRTRGGGCG